MNTHGYTQGSTLYLYIMALRDAHVSSIRNEPAGVLSIMLSTHVMCVRALVKLPLSGTVSP